MHCGTALIFFACVCVWPFGFRAIQVGLPGGSLAVGSSTNFKFHSNKQASNNNQNPPTNVDPFQITDEIGLNFFGTVTRMPVDGALPVCTAFGQTFYLTSSGFDKMTSAHGYCPAWLVKFLPDKETEDKSGNASVKTHPKTNLKFKEYTLYMPYSYDDMEKKQSIRVPVTFYKLVPYEGCLGLTMANLARGPHPQQVKVIAKKPDPSTKTVVKGAPEAWKDCKHLYL